MSPTRVTKHYYNLYRVPLDLWMLRTPLASSPYYEFSEFPMTPSEFDARLRQFKDLELLLAALDTLVTASKAKRNKTRKQSESTSAATNYVRSFLTQVLTKHQDFENLEGGRKL